MQGARIRQQQPVTGRSKPVPRGASRRVADEPVSARLPRPSLGGLKRLLWPVLLVAAGLLGWGLLTIIGITWAVRSLLHNSNGCMTIGFVIPVFYLGQKISSVF